MNLTYLRYEIVRTFRNRRFFIFSLIFPLLLFLLIAGPLRGNHDFQGTGISAVTYFMVGMAGFGAMGAAVSGGARISAERQVGWNRQLRITPLSPRNYFRAKVLASYLMSLLSIALLYAAGLSLGVHMPIADWVRMTWLMLVALAPFAALGIVAGHLLTPDAIGPAMGGGMALFALIGGSWGPIVKAGSGIAKLVKLVPSYWLVQAGQAALGGKGWTTEGWVVIGVWTLGLALLGGKVYQRDTKKV